MTVPSEEAGGIDEFQHLLLLLLLSVGCGVLYTMNHHPRLPTLPFPFPFRRGSTNKKEFSTAFKSAGDKQEDEDEDDQISPSPSPSLCPQENEKEKENLDSSYLLVYGLVTLADWLQGSYLYALLTTMFYSPRDIGFLYGLGFASSAMAGPFLGWYADKGGRRWACLLFCLCGLISCLTKLPLLPYPTDFHSQPNKWTWHFFFLCGGKVLGGLGTALLHSAFESWIVGAYRMKGISPSHLPSLFERQILLKGILAILSGFLATLLVNLSGKLWMPFLVAGLVCLGAGGVIGLRWDENFGNCGEEEDSPSVMFCSLPTSAKKPPSSPPSSTPTLSSSLTCSTQLSAIPSLISSLNLQSPFKLLSLLLLQTTFESSMYILVLLWTPLLSSFSPSSNPPPYGLIFTGFMVSIMAGSQIFGLLVKRPGLQKGRRRREREGVEGVLELAVWIGGVALGLIAIFPNQYILLLSFNLFELSCGLYFPALSATRTPLLPERHRTALLTLMRIPLNLVILVFMGTFGEVVDLYPLIFLVCSVSLFISNYFFLKF